MSPAWVRRRGVPTLEQLRERVRAVGLRVTPPRLAVTRLLWQASAPMTHGQLVELLAPEGWDPKTIHRNLTDLTEAGLLRRTDVGDHVWRFELRSVGEVPDAGHPHFICGACGAVLCMPLSIVRVSGGIGLPECLSSGAVEIQVKGHCDRCT